MYAVIETGGKQYRVQPGDIVQVEKLEGEVGTALKFDQILLVSKPGEDKSEIWLGKPLLAGALVQAEIVGQGRGEKVRITKMKRRKQYRRQQGHRQFQTQLLILGVDNGSGAKLALSGDEKKAKLSKYITNLTPKGLPRTPAKNLPGPGPRAGAAVPVIASTAKKPAAKKAKAST